ncbi:hypothetical protein GXW71_03005 [Roseomonas hellenica]|uniref:Dienelactone hydrolase family protein n=1 Tax=Plastoroseomonas hellenica TaxID=2687306 RepID=A0ABS5ESQ1_9PROT|nr:hypothetical protein [Plastoroseomonas hellenica]MBR0663316.1 hypothetical protein [Plastoroseomonas hellenica]
MPGTLVPRLSPRPIRRTAWAIVGAMLALALLLPERGLAAGSDGPDAVGLLWLPDGEAPSVPPAVVIAVHELTGIDPRGWRYGEQITAAGIAVLHVELRDVSADNAGSAAVADDAAAALARLLLVIDILAEDPRFANAGLGLLAFGTAGEAAMLAAADPVYGGRIAALVLLYPGCAGLDAAAATAGGGLRSPVLLLHGDADPANSPADCSGLAARLAHTAPVRRVQYAGASYAWDWAPSGLHEVPELPWPGQPGLRVAVRHSPEGAALSATRAASFFAAAFAARQR